jgi:phospholipid/cholesterol/gamma-HCH transport system permease protein
MFYWLGRQTLKVIFGIGDYSLFTAKAFCALAKSKRLVRRIVSAIHEQGTVCLPVILIVGLFTGLVLGLQGYHVLSRF